MINGASEECSYPYGSKTTLNVFEVVPLPENVFHSFEEEMTAYDASNICYNNYAGPSSTLGFDDLGVKTEGMLYVMHRVDKINLSFRIEKLVG